MHLVLTHFPDGRIVTPRPTWAAILAARSFFPPLATFKAWILAAAFLRSTLGAGFLLVFCAGFRGFLAAAAGTVLDFFALVAVAAVGKPLAFVRLADFIILPGSCQ
jgi:hypothetical protein